MVAEAVGGEEEPASAAELSKVVAARKGEWEIADGDAVRAVFLGLVDVALSGGATRNQQQVTFSVLRAVKAYSSTLRALCPGPRVEAALLAAVQVTCYEESRLLKLFKDIVKVLYDADVVGEPAIRYWYTKGSTPKGRNVFLHDMQPFIQWLDEAEEEDSDEE